jgi:ribosomal protein S18 acetylase RimI-like enzyme
LAHDRELVDPLEPRQGRTRVHVPFMYDLGGRVKNIDGLRRTLAELYGSVEVDQAATRSWNLSYLAGHTPVVRCRLTGGAAQFADSEWRYERILKIFPWLGVLSIDYLFESRGTETNISTFYDRLVEWKNADYLPYLQECGAFTDELAAHTAFTSSVLTQDLHASLVRQLRLRVQPYINPRPAMYAFHDFRVCFIDHGSLLDASLVQCLLWLTVPEAANGTFEHVEGVQHGSVEIVSTGWSTVLRTDMRTAGAEVTEIMSLLSLVHAQWYICQLWINVYDQDFKALDSIRLQAFLPFRGSHRDARLPQIGVCIYVSTISVRPVARGRSLACKLYLKLFELPETLPEWVLLRTWSTNTHHLRLLDTLGFKLLLTVPDDRDLGVDTVYLGRKR